MCLRTLEYHSATNRKETLARVTTWRDLEGVMLSEISRAEKDRGHMLSLICRI